MGFISIAQISIWMILNNEQDFSIVIFSSSVKSKKVNSLTILTTGNETRGQVELNENLRVLCSASRSQSNQRINVFYIFDTGSECFFSKNSQIRVESESKCIIVICNKESRSKAFQMKEIGKGLKNHTHSHENRQKNERNLSEAIIYSFWRWVETRP